MTMISFIVIGRNEGWKLKKCLDSVVNCIAHNRLNEYEVIYVDSASTDDSVKTALSYQGVKLFSITGRYNAAVARNIGAKESIGDVLFFIDGDMEIEAAFLEKVFSTVEGLKHDFVSGNWVNHNYDNSGRLVSQEHYLMETKSDRYVYTTGGIFIIRRELWFKVGGMRTKFKRNEDLDLGLRLANIGSFMLRKQNVIAVHHTIPYNDKKRMWSLLFSGSELYRILLLRENILNKYAWKHFARGNYTVFIMLGSILASQYFMNYIYMIVYLSAVLIRICKRGETSFRLLASRFLYIPTYEASLLLGLLLFWPREIEDSMYILVQRNNDLGIQTII